jgi:hypothetical protein
MHAPARSADSSSVRASAAPKAVTFSRYWFAQTSPKPRRSVCPTPRCSRVCIPGPFCVLMLTTRLHRDPDVPPRWTRDVLNNALLDPARARTAPRAPSAPPRRGALAPALILDKHRRAARRRHAVRTREAPAARRRAPRDAPGAPTRARKPAHGHARHDCPALRAGDRSQGRCAQCPSAPRG